MDAFSPNNGQDITRQLDDLLQKPGVAEFAGFLHKIQSANDTETIWDFLTAFVRAVGFEHLIYGYSPDSRRDRLGAPEYYQMMSTLEPQVFSEMVERGFHAQSATFHWALGNEGIAKWSKPIEECGVGPEFVVTPEAQEFFERNNLLAGCTIGLPSQRSWGRAAMALVAPAGTSQHSVDDMMIGFEDLIFVVATAAHRSIISLPQAYPNSYLTQRQREVLEWVAEGKTIADISTIMNISVPTVEKHLRLAREALGVETTAHALIKAAYLNQVFVLEKRKNE